MMLRITVSCNVVQPHPARYGAIQFSGKCLARPLSAPLPWRERVREMGINDWKQRAFSPQPSPSPVKGEGK
jgi:hypothetical protein